jgi:F0F1-type ATP synthase assembly protein I
MPEDRPSPSELGYYFALAQVGLEIVGFLGLGLLVDYWLGSSPWGLISGTILGFVGGLYHLLTLVSRHDRETQDQKKKDQAP